MEKVFAPVEPTLIKQIAGRAGRKSTRFADDGGFVGASTTEDLDYVRKVLALPMPDIPKAGVFPPSEILEAFANENNLHSKPLNDVVDEFAKVCTVDESLFFFCGHHELSSASAKLDGALQRLKKNVTLPVADALVFCAAPCNTNDRFALSMLANYALAHYEAVVLGKPGRIAPNVRIPNGPPRLLTGLHDLCSKHNVLDLYIWLSFRYPNTFPEANLARAQKARCIDLIAKTLQADIVNVSNTESQQGPASARLGGGFRYPPRPTMRKLPQRQRNNKDNNKASDVRRLLAKETSSSKNNNKAPKRAEAANTTK